MPKKTNRRYINGAELERQVKKYFEAEGFDAMRSAGSKGTFDVMADNGITTWKVQCKRHMSEKEANKLADELVQDQAEKFPVISHPVIILVVQGMEKGKPIGITRALLPAEGKGDEESPKKAG